QSFGGTCRAGSICWTGLVEPVQPSSQREFGEVVLMRLALALILVPILAVTSAGVASAEVPADWPDRPLRMIVPLPAGSAVDVIARLISQRLSVRLGQPVVVENRAGASGVIGSDMVAKAAPDGLTLGMATSTTHMTAPVLNAKLP